MENDDMRFAVAQRKGHVLPFVLRVFGKDPVIFTSFGPYTKGKDGQYRSASFWNEVKICSVHDTHAEAKAACF